MVITFFGTLNQLPANQANTMPNSNSFNFPNTHTFKKLDHGMANRWEKMEAVTDFIFLGSKITASVTAAMKLKDACSLEEKI